MKAVLKFLAWGLLGLLLGATMACCFVPWVWAYTP